LGCRRVREGVGLFPYQDVARAAAGPLVHVSDPRARGRPVAIPDDTRAVLDRLLITVEAS
ncbi:MAG: acyl-CoA thioesterase, partial [Perlucidibaca sp.]